MPSIKIQLAHLSRSLHQHKFLYDFFLSFPLSKAKEVQKWVQSIDIPGTQSLSRSKAHKGTNFLPRTIVKEVLGLNLYLWFRGIYVERSPWLLTRCPSSVAKAAPRLPRLSRARRFSTRYGGLKAAKNTVSIGTFFFFFFINIFFPRRRGGFTGKYCMKGWLSDSRDSDSARYVAVHGTLESVIKCIDSVTKANFYNIRKLLAFSWTKYRAHLSTLPFTNSLKIL